jgi:hypothetical protein
MSARPIGYRRARRPPAGALRVRRAIALAGCGVLTVAVSACESTEQESAKIGREEQQAASSQATPKPPPAPAQHHARKHRAGHSQGGSG